VPAGKRLVCANCLRPEVACICAWITVVPHTVEVLILQHPLEVVNPKGSARLLHLCLPRSRLLVGETFDPAQLQALLAGRHNVLLYPATPEQASPGIALPPAFERASLPARALQLVVLDGTWRKSRKMLYQNPLLQSVPRLSLRDTPPSHYLIRKAHAPDQLSTLEASCYALMQLEAEPQRLLPLIDAFDRLMAHLVAQRSQRG
jgi:DTW domain-containing protein YfiP